MGRVSSPGIRDNLGQEFKKVHRWRSGAEKDSMGVFLEEEKTK